MIVYPNFFFFFSCQTLRRFRSSSLLEARLYQLRRDSLKKGAKDIKTILAFLKTQQEDVTTASPPPPAASPVSSTSSVASASTFTPVAAVTGNSLPASSAKPDEYPVKKVLDLLGDVDLLVGPFDHWNQSVDLLNHNGTVPFSSSAPLFPWFTLRLLVKIFL